MKRIPLFVACLFLAFGFNALSAVGVKGQVAQKQGGAGSTGITVASAPDAKFTNHVKSNVLAPKSVEELQFTSKDGGMVRLADYKGKKNVVLVFTQGF